MDGLGSKEGPAVELFREDVIAPGEVNYLF